MKFIVPGIAVLVIGTLEAYAISQGINGTCLSASYAAIGAVAGGSGVYGWLKKRGGNGTRRN